MKIILSLIKYFFQALFIFLGLKFLIQALFPNSNLTNAGSPETTIIKVLGMVLNSFSP